MIDFSLLDSLSRLLVRRLMERYPEWPQIGEIDDEADGENWVVLFKISQPGTDECFWIHALDGEVMLSFAGWHTHAGLWMRGNEDSAVDGILEMLQRIFEDRLVVVTCGDDGGASLQSVEHPIDPTSGVVTKVHSWLRTHDRIVVG